MNLFNKTRRFSYFFKYLHNIARNYPKKSPLVVYKSYLNQKVITCYRTVYDDSTNLLDYETNDVTQLIQYHDTLQQQYVKHLLYPDSKDHLIQQFNKCQSIQEVFDTIQANLKEMKHMHITQAILVLWDLQKVFLFSQNLHYVTENDPLVHDYMHQLIVHPGFKQLIELAKEKHSEFDAESISCFLLYISKMGVIFDHEFLEFFLKLQKLFKTKMSLKALSRIVVAVRSELSFNSLYLILDIVPFVLKELEKCQTLNDLKLVTICLNHLHQVVTDDILREYMEKVKEVIIDTSKLDRSSYRPLLKILSFLHYPQWSNKCSNLSSELVLCMKDNIHMLTVHELFVLFEILLKNQEPAEVLTEMQRCASKLYLNLEEDCYISPETKLKLLSCIVCFSSPLNRHEYEKMLNKLLTNPPSTLNSMYDLLRILTFIKPANTNLCKLFWDNILEMINKKDFENDSGVLLRLCLRYMNATNDIKYRHKEFEKQMLIKLENHFKHEIMLLIPSQISIAAAFVLTFGKQGETTNVIVKSVIDNCTQFNYLDCLYISKSLRNLEFTNRFCLTSCQFKGLQSALDESVRENLKISDPSKNNFLLKSCIYRKSTDRNLTNELLLKCNTGNMSSSFLRNIVFSLQTTSSLLPEIMESICNYIISCKNYVLGFNAEKVAYLCYYLGYFPKNLDDVFQNIADIILRDQERISGLSYIHVALALCFFNKLPDSFIKHIFNVRFLEKIEAELATCYFKDRYPIRVRNSMMQLNRAVCLDYPEANVPWFHQKFIENRSEVKESCKDIVNVKNYLLQLVDDAECLVENVTTAYGYQLDFEMHLDERGEIVKPGEHMGGTKIAILVANNNSYTTVNVQLKGKHQLKKRHLEILGYKVIIINVSEWNMLVFGNEKLQYLHKIISPNLEKYNQRLVKK